MRRTVFLGCGSHVPERVLTNAELARRVDTSNEWIVERTGIRERRIAAEGEKTSDLAIVAARRALQDANVEPGEVDLVLLATATPDLTFPATATAVQAALGIRQGAAFDLQAVCSGFVYGLSVADALLKDSQFRTALLIGAETFSRILDWEDRATCVLFGDGAGAVVLRGTEGAGTNADRGLLAHKIYADGAARNLLYVDGGVSATGTIGKLRMQGREVFKHAVTKTADAIEAVCAHVGLAVAEVDWIVPHQANQRILSATAKRLNVPEARVISTVARHGNTSAASVPLALDAALKDGRIKRGDLVVFEAMGGGFTWGASLARW